MPPHYVQTWVDPDTGVANNFLDSLKIISSNPEVVMLLILGVFAASHSGLAYLRPWGKLHGLNTPTYMHVSQLYCSLSALPASTRCMSKAFTPCAMNCCFQRYQAACKKPCFAC